MKSFPWRKLALTKNRLVAPAAGKSWESRYVLRTSWNNRTQGLIGEDDAMTGTRFEMRNPSIDAVQSDQYVFPYHYIPSPNAYLKLSRSWVYAASYIAAINLAKHWLADVLATKKQGLHRHMDFGCGDGGFLHALSQNERFRDVVFEGIDIDQRALQWGELFSSKIPNVNLQCGNLMQIRSETYDSGTLIEVFEHIPPDEAPSFVSGIANSLKRDAMLFVTVPSTEVPVSDKHYRHFDFGSIQHCFSGQFHVVSCFGFEKSSPLSRILKRLMIQRRIYIETSVTSNYFVKEYARTFPEVRGCGRIGLFLSKK